MFRLFWPEFSNCLGLYAPKCLGPYNLWLQNYVSATLLELTEEIGASKPDSVMQRNHQTTVLLENSGWHPLRPEHPFYFPDSVWLYAGPEIYSHGGGGTRIGDLKYIIRKGHYQVAPSMCIRYENFLKHALTAVNGTIQTDIMLTNIAIDFPFSSQTRVKTFTSLAAAPLRAVCWDRGTHVILFPTLAEYPIVRGPARTDLRRCLPICAPYSGLISARAHARMHAHARPSTNPRTHSRAYARRARVHTLTLRTCESGQRHRHPDKRTCTPPLT